MSDIDSRIIALLRKSLKTCEEIARNLLLHRDTVYKAIRALKYEGLIQLLCLQKSTGGRPVHKLEMVK